jgi:hypothetical protein
MVSNDGGKGANVACRGWIDSSVRSSVLPCGEPGSLALDAVGLPDNELSSTRDTQQPGLLKVEPGRSRLESDDLIETDALQRSASSNKLANLVCRQLERVRADTLLPLLDAGRRWQLFVELLLGHAKVRGGRTRDYPFSQDRQDSCRIVALLRGRTRRVRHWSAEAKVDVPDHLLVVALQMVVAAEVADRPQAELRSERFYSEGLRFLIQEIVADDDGTLRGTLADQLGLGGNQTQDSKAWNWQSGPVKAASLLAALSCERHRSALGGELHIAPGGLGRANAALARRQLDTTDLLLKRLGPSESLLQTLRHSRVRVAGIQAKRVQTLIDQCQLSFIQRGASFWISHNIARLRDHFANDALSAGTLIVDNEAKTWFVLPPSSAEGGLDHRQQLDALEQVAREALYDGNDQLSPKWVARHFPRLEPFVNAARAEGKPQPSGLPAVEISIRESSLLDLAFDAMSPAWQLGDGTMDPDVRVINPGSDAVEQAVTSALPESKCSGVYRHQRLADPEFAIPRWLRSNAGEGYGLAGIAYGLAAHAFARASADAIKTIISDLIGRAVQVPETQRELASATGRALKRLENEADTSPLVHVKLDGDGIGRLFLSHSSLWRPGVSMALEDLIRQAWIVAMAGLIERFDLSHLPALLIYLGGDDLLMTMPRPLVEPFMREFDNALEDGCRNTGLDVRFTFACIGATDAGASETGGAPAESIRAVNAALMHAKSCRSLEPTPQGWLTLGRLHGLLG